MTRPPTHFRSAFTLVELLIAIAIIVLLLGLAMPAFRVISGSRSQEGASNQIAAMLARARNDAVGLQVNTGVAFYTDTGGRCHMVEVQQAVPLDLAGGGTAAGPVARGTYATDGNSYYVATADIPAGSSPALGGAPWQSIGTVAQFPDATAIYDQVIGTDAESLPVGVGAQTLVDAGTASTGSQDRYMHSGAVLFDLNGRLVCAPYGFSRYGLVGHLMGADAGSFDIAQNAGTLVGTPPVFGSGHALYSGPGLVTYDGEAATGQGFPTTDYNVVGGTMSTAEQTEQGWLDQNATPLLVNRYNGTLLRSE